MPDLKCWIIPVQEVTIQPQVHEHSSILLTLGQHLTPQSLCKGRSDRVARSISSWCTQPLHWAMKGAVTTNNRDCTNSKMKEWVHALNVNQMNDRVQSIAQESVHSTLVINMKFASFIEWTFVRSLQLSCVFIPRGICITRFVILSFHRGHIKTETCSYGYKHIAHNLWELFSCEQLVHAIGTVEQKTTNCTILGLHSYMYLLNHISWSAVCTVTVCTPFPHSTGKKNNLQWHCDDMLTLYQPMMHMSRHGLSISQ